MTILRDIRVSLTPEGVLRAQRRNQRATLNPALASIATEAIAIGQAIASPSVLYDEFQMQGTVGEQAVISADRSDEQPENEFRQGRLTLGPKIDLLAPARRVMVAGATIGPALENRVHELFASGDHVLAFMLDSVGVMMLGAVGEAVRCKAEERAAELGWGVGPALAPGSLVGWHVRGQRELCALLPLEKIGVHLNEQCMLVPQKSSTLVIGLGPDYDTSHVGSVCNFCSLAESCWRRREDWA